MPDFTVNPLVDAFMVAQSQAAMRSALGAAPLASPAFTTQITTPKIVFTGSVIEVFGAGSPEGVVTAAVGSVFHRTDGGASTALYFKGTGSGNTGWVAVGTGSGSVDWGAITGTLSSQTDLNTALGLKAPLANPHLTGDAQVNGTLYLHDGAEDIFFADEGGFVLSKPLAETVREIGDSDSTTILISDLVINYKRTDADPLVAPDAGSGFSGQHLTVNNSSGAPFVLDGAVSDSFYDGANGVVDSLTIAIGESVGLISENEGTDTIWRVLYRYSAAAAGGGVALNSTQDFRLTTESGVPVSTGDRTAQSTLYFTPSDGNQIALYNGSTWDLISSPEVSLVLSGLTDATNYDIFAFPNSGLVELELSAPWSGPNTPTDAIVLQDGVSVKSSDHTRRWVGTLRTTSTTTTEDSVLNRFLWNLDNQANRALNIVSGPFHTYGTSTWREWNGGGGAYRVSFVSGSVQWFRVGGNFEMNGSGPSYGSIGLNSSTVEGEAGVSTELGSYLRMACGCVYQNLIGFNQLVPIEMSFGSGNYASFRINAIILN